MTRITAKKLKKFLLSCTIIFTLLIFLFLHEIDQQERRIKESLLSQLDTIEKEINNKIDRTEQVLLHMNRDIIKNPTKEGIKRVMDLHKANSYFTSDLSWTWFSWVNKQDILTVDTKYGILKKPIKLTKKHYPFKTKTNPGKIYLTPPVIGVTSKKWILAGGVGLQKNNEHIGAMTVGFEIESLANFIREKIKDKNITFKLIDSSNNKLIFHITKSEIKNFPQENNDLSPEVKKMVERLEKTKEKEVYYVDINLNKKEAIIIKKPHDLKLIYALKYEKKDIRNQFLDSYLSKIKIIILILLILIALTFAAKYAFVKEK